MATTGVAFWSQTAGTNASADSSVNWAEGQAPSTINDSARNMMASTAKWRDDISGAIVTGGTSTAYTVTSYQQFPNLSALAGQIIAFTPHTTNTGTACTLNVDSLGAKPLRSAPSVEIGAGTLVQGTPYLALYNNSDQAFYLHGFFGNPYNIPVGSGLDFWGSTAPNSSFVFLYGQAISRSTYSTLFSLLSTTYGTGDGSTTFNLPDLRGRIVAGKDDMGGSAASRLTSSYFGGTATNLGATGGSESHTLTTAQMPTHTHNNTLTDPGHTHLVNMGSTGGLVVPQGSLNASGSNYTTPSATTGITLTNASAGSGNAHNNVQPTIIANYIMRII